MLGLLVHFLKIHKLTKCAYNVPTTFQKDFVSLHSVFKDNDYG